MDIATSLARCIFVVALAVTLPGVGSAVADDTRTVIIINSTDDLDMVRVHVLGFKGGVSSHDVKKESQVEVNNILVGDRAVAAYDLQGKLLVVRKMTLNPGAEPARIAVFGNKTDGYRVDFGL